MKDQDQDFERHYSCISHTPRNCWQPTDEEAWLPLISGRLYAPLATIEKLRELKGPEGDYNQALQALAALPQKERQKYPFSNIAVAWRDVPKSEWRLLTFCYRDFSGV